MCRAKKALFSGWLIDILPELLLSIAEVCHAVLASGRQIDPIEWRTSFIKRRRRPTCQFHGELKEDPSVRLSAGQAINLGGREEDLVLVSSTLSLTALHSARSRSNLCTQFYCPDKSDEDSADWVGPPVHSRTESIRLRCSPRSPMSKCHFKRKSGPIEADS